MYPPLCCCNPRTCRCIPCPSFRRNWGSKLFHLSTSARARSSSVTTSFCLLTLRPIRSQQVLDGIHIETPAGPLKYLNPFLGKEYCNNTGHYRPENGTCSLMCIKIRVHNRLKVFVDITLSCQSMSNHNKISLVVMTKPAPHHNGSTTDHFSFGNNVFLKRVLSTSTPNTYMSIRKS